MADGDGPRSDAIRAAVSALSLEKGFECAEKNTIEVLSETLKSCKCTSNYKQAGHSGLCTTLCMVVGYRTVTHRDAYRSEAPMNLQIICRPPNVWGTSTFYISVRARVVLILNC